MRKITNKPDLKAITIRIPPEIYQWLAEQAEQEQRSINAEVYLLLLREYRATMANRPPFGD